MKKVFLPLIVFCLVAALFVILGDFGDKDVIPAFYDGNKNKNVIYIGVYEPMTEDYKQGGMSEVLGIRYANSVCPTVDIGGVTYDVVLVEADNSADEIGSAYAAKKLIKANVSAVLGSYSSKANAAGVPEFESHGLPVVDISCSSQSATEGSSNYFRLCCTDTFQSGIMANLAYSMNLRHAAVLTQTGDEYSKDAGKIFADAFKKLGGEVTEFAFQLGQENYRSLSEEIANSDADFVYMLSGSFEAKYFIKQSRSNAIRCPIMGPQSWDSALLLNDVTFHYKDVYFASEFDSGSLADPVSVEFASRFSSWLNNDTQRIEDNGGNTYTSAYSAMAYDAYMLVIEAIKKADSSDPQAVKDVLKTISYKGVIGEISFDANGETLKKQAFIKTINIASKQFEVLQISTVGS